MVLGKKDSGSGVRLFRVFGKTGSGIRHFFDLKRFRDQDGANKKRLSQIGPAVPELLSFRQTYIQTDKNPYYFVVLIVQPQVIILLQG